MPESAIDARFRELVEATATFDHEGVNELCNEIADRLAADNTADQGLAERGLSALRNKRHFTLLVKVADALIQAGLRSPKTQKLYAQGLIDSGSITAAIGALERLEKETEQSNAKEHAEALGLLGRAYKQQYVNGGSAPATPRREKLLRTSIEYYESAYQKYKTELREIYWHGINVVALIARGRRDGLSLDGFPDHKDRARELLNFLGENVDGYDIWEQATQAEALVALENWNGALAAVARYVGKPYTDAFELGSTLRQFVEVWQLGEEPDDPTTPLFVILRSQLASRLGGGVELSSATAEIQRVQGTKEQTQAVLGNEGILTLRWYEAGLARSRSVAQLGNGYAGVGTGFLVRGGDIRPDWGDEQLLLTNYHVLGTTSASAVDSREAVVTFEALDGRTQEYRIKDVVWSVPHPYDACVARLDRPVEKSACCGFSLTVPPVKKEPPTRVFIIGHPDGKELSFSLYDNLLLGYRDPTFFYRAPTKAGSSGSPVFNEAWNVIALHRATHDFLPGFENPNEMIRANSGAWIGAIQKEAQKQK